MTSIPRMKPVRGAWARVRLTYGLVVIGILFYTYVLGREIDGLNPFDYFGYFTNQTNLLTAAVFITLGVLGILGRAAPEWLTLARAIATTCMLLVGVIYNLVVPGTGSAPLWVSVILHIVAPLFVLLDWAFARDRPALPWSSIWIAFPYPLIWLVVVLVRGATDGWVPYGFLLTSRGPLSLTLHIVGLMVALGCLAAVTWGLSRLGRMPGPGDRGEESLELTQQDSARQA